MSRYLSRYCIVLLSSLFICAGCQKQAGTKKETAPTALAELKQKVLDKRAEKKYDAAVECLHEIIKEYPDHKDINSVKLTLADTYMKIKNYPAAFQLYDNFVLSCPSDKNAEVARYQSILAKFYQTLSPDRDQTCTSESMSLCKNYLASSANIKYRKDVQDIYNTCEQKLIDKELYVYNFYLNSGEYKAAEGRLDYIRENYLNKQKDQLEPRLLFLECKLAQAQHNQETLEKSVDKLYNEYPSSPYTRMTQAFIERNKAPEFSGVI